MSKNPTTIQNAMRELQKEADKKTKKQAKKQKRIKKQRERLDYRQYMQEESRKAKGRYKREKAQKEARSYAKKGKTGIFREALIGKKREKTYRPRRPAKRYAIRPRGTYYHKRKKRR